MTHNNGRPVRVVKRGQAAREERKAVDAVAASARESEREVKTVVSGWVREHRERAEEFRLAFAGLLRDVGFNPASSTSRA